MEKKIIDIEQLTEELKVDIKFIASITGIEEEFFAKYLDNNQQSFLINDVRIIK